MLSKTLLDICYTNLDCNESIFRAGRERKFMDSKHIIRYMLREYTDMSYHSIGRVTSCNHATVINSCRRAQSLYATDDEFKSKCDIIEDEIMKITRHINTVDKQILTAKELEMLVTESAIVMAVILGSKTFDDILGIDIDYLKILSIKLEQDRIVVSQGNRELYEVRR